MNKKDPIYIYANLIIKNANLFILLILLSFFFTYFTIKNNLAKSTSSLRLSYASSFMQITPLDPLYFNNFSDFRLNLKDSSYIKFVREYVRDFKEKCLMEKYPKEDFLLVDIPGTTNKDDYRVNLSTIQINYLWGFL